MGKWFHPIKSLHMARTKNINDVSLKQIVYNGIGKNVHPIKFDN